MSRWTGLDPAMAEEPFKVLLVLPDLDTPASWVTRLVKHLQTAGAIELCAITVAARGPVRRRTAGAILFHWVRRLELAAGAGRVADVSENAADLWQGLPKVQIEDERAIAALSPDVILDLSDNYGRGLPAELARHGVWFTDATDPATGYAGLRPLLDDQSVSRIALFRRGQRDSMPEEIASAAVNIKFMATRNARFIEEKSVTLILRELRRVAAGLAPLSQVSEVLFVAPAAPRLTGVLAYLVRMSGELLRRGWWRMCEKRGFRPGMFCLHLSVGDFKTFAPGRAQAVKPIGNCYHADPFLWQHDDKTWCFFEIFDYAANIGRIGAGRLEAGELVDVRTVLQPGYHLSFPFLFEHDGRLFMMPESCATRRIELWRCTEFPDCWDLHSTALEGSSPADSTLAQIDGQWWLFTNLADDPFGDMSSELHLFRADSPMLERLEPHPLNPVVFDSRSARNAGRIVMRDGVLWRPAQDNSHGTYGYGLNLMRIEELTHQSYRESVGRQIAPDFKRGIIGCHHIDCRGERIVFDVRYRLGWRG